jgi:predicted AAA+ superfamily ATPase
MVEEALADTRVVLVTGARQCGKSTLVRLLAKDKAGEWRNLDTAAVRQAAMTDPAGFVDFPDLMVIDEVQRVPDLLLSIKEQVDTDPRPGRVVGIEVKASSTVRPDDFKGLRHLAARLGGDFVAGVVLYTGTQTLPFGDRLRAMPVSTLWEAGPPGP